VFSGFIASQATAQSEISDMIAADGLARTEAHLAALEDPTPTELFALGGVRFLGGIEAALQARWQVGLDSEMLRSLGIPLLRLPIAPNPSPDVFRPEMIDAIFAAASADMTEAARTLDGIEGEVSLPIDVADLWFDVNGNGSRDVGESVIDIAGFALGGGFGQSPDAVTIRFDTADVAWLRAYAHLLAGISDTIGAIGPTDPIARVMETAEGFLAVAGAPRPSVPYSIAAYQDEIDLVAMIIFALEQTPDSALSRKAHGHFLSMIEDNRQFWSEVALETDNDAEWIPNKNQVSALGLPFPPETGTRWLAVLSDAERVLRGELLIPYWRLGPGAGLDLGAMFTDPPALDPVGLIQGETLLPYARTGPLANMESLRLFEALIGGNAGLYMVMLN
jgi:hypothetical protein